MLKIYFYKKLFFISILFGLLFLFNKSVLASEDFFISGKSEYKVNYNGKTQVKHKIELINKKTDVYATQYALSVASTKINNVWAEDETSGLSPKIKTNGNQTTISIDFNHRSVGLGQSLDFTIGYEDHDISQKIGRIWEINISQPSNLHEFQNYTISVDIPKSFEDPILIIPDPISQTKSEESILYEFTKNILFGKGITAIFGAKQVFSFDLRYTLENINPFKKNFDIAIPPDTLYQKVFYETITPLPNDIKVDVDGNWLAEITLDARETTEVHVIGYAVLSLEPELNKNSIEPDLSIYLKPQPPWQTENPTIKELARNLKTVENIYNFVVENLSYNFERIAESNKRLGAVGALANPDQSICMEFTDLFIALSRAAGIPAREVNGFAYTNNSSLRPLSLKQDILHSWPEYFSKDTGVWVPVDPTWGNTTQGIDYFSKFDLNHFTFVIHGSNSQLPFPPGFYKTKKQFGKDIIVLPSDIIPKSSSDYKISFEKLDNITAGFPTTAKAIISNSGNVSKDSLDISIFPEGFDIQSQKKHSITNFLPFSKQEIPIKIIGRNLFNDSDAKISISINEKVYEESFKIKPIYSRWKEAAIILAVGTAIAATSKKTRRVLFSIFKK